MKEKNVLYKTLNKAFNIFAAENVNTQRVGMTFCVTVV